MRPLAAPYVIVTHDHSLDFQLTAEALKRRDAGYVGMIGSKTKRASFLRWARGERQRPYHRGAHLPDWRHVFCQ